MINTVIRWYLSIGQHFAFWIDRGCHVQLSSKFGIITSSSKLWPNLYEAQVRSKGKTLRHTKIATLLLKHMLSVSDFYSMFETLNKKEISDRP